VRHTLGTDPEENATAVCATVRKLVEHFKWTGVTGCSITKEISRLLGVEGDFSLMEASASERLNKFLRGRVSFTHAMIHTTAAGYSDLVWGDSASESLWRGQIVLVCTLGKNLGAVIFNDGRRVRHREWCHVTTAQGSSEVNDSCPPQVCEAELPQPGETGGGGVCEIAPEEADGSSPPKFRPPPPDSSSWENWTATVDGHLAEIVSSVSSLDRVFVMPTGRTAGLSWKLSKTLLPRLVRTLEVANAKGCAVSLVDQREGAVARGAALCALVELKSVQMLDSLKQVFNHADSLQSLSEAELRYIFEQLDVGCDGFVQPHELRDGLALLGLQRDLGELQGEIGVAEGEGVPLEKFMSWWLRSVKGARIVTLTSAAAWEELLLRREAPEGFGDLILLEVTFTFCRSCRRFEPKFRKLAEAHTDVRFVQLVGNGTIGAMELVSNELKVRSSPAFFVFRRGGELLASWTGANAERLEANLAECRTRV